MNGWIAVQTAAGGWRINTRDNLNIAMVAGGKDSEKEAKLIASAPDMLSALRLCVHNVGVPVRDGMANAMERRLLQINEIAQAAIAKAEGRAE